MSATPGITLANSQQIIADLRQELADVQQRLDEQIVEREEAQAREAAIAEILQVINSSPGELAPVFEAMLEKAMRLCDVAFGFLTIYDGKSFRPAALRGVPPALAEYFTSGMDQPRPGEAHSRLLAGEDLIHSIDQMDEEPYR